MAEKEKRLTNRRKITDKESMGHLYNTRSFSAIQLSPTLAGASRNGNRLRLGNGRSESP